MTEQLPAVKAPVRAGAQVAALVPQTLEEAYRLAEAMSRSGLTPNGIKTPEAVLVAIMAGAELGLAPFQSCMSFAVINGRASLWGDGIPALLLSNGFKLTEWYENEANDFPDDMCAHCRITRPDGDQIEADFSVADAKKAKLWTKDGPWQTAPKRMLRMRARAFAARDGAADLLRGLFVAEEAQDFAPVRDVDAGTGMVERLRALPADVDAPGFNVRQIHADTTQSLDRVLDGDNLPDASKPHRKRGRPRKDATVEQRAEDALAKAAGPVVSQDATHLDYDEPAEVLAEAVQNAEAIAETITEPDPANPALIFDLAMDHARSYREIRDALVAFRRSEVYRQSTPEKQKDWQVEAWETLQLLAHDGAELPTPADDPWVFSLFLLVGEREAINAYYEALKASPAYLALNKAQQDFLAEAYERATATLI